MARRSIILGSPAVPRLLRFDVHVFYAAGFQPGAGTTQCRAPMRISSAFDGTPAAIRA
jgi:hypothetical protein